MTPILMSYVNRYIKNLKPSDLQLSLWGGDVVLSKLELKLDVLEQVSSVAVIDWKHFQLVLKPSVLSCTLTLCSKNLVFLRATLKLETFLYRKNFFFNGLLLVMDC